jgi:hypothetical protein
MRLNEHPMSALTQRVGVDRHHGGFDRVGVPASRCELSSQRLHGVQQLLPQALPLGADPVVVQVEREASWFRLAGFTMDAPPIDVVLSGSASGVP